MKKKKSNVKKIRMVAHIDFDLIKPGDIFSIHKSINNELVESFAALSGDYNPLHMDEDFAMQTSFRRRVVHGMLPASYVSTLIGTHFPGALWTQQDFRWKSPVFIGDDLDITLQITHKSTATRTLTFEVKAVNQRGVVVMEGKGAFMVLERQNSKSELPLSERLALVTGSSRGIGAAIALTLGSAGAKVIVNFKKSSTQAEEVCHTILKNHGQAIAIQADVTDNEAINSLFQTAKENFGKSVDILVNNAGGELLSRPFLEMTWADIEHHFNVHVRGAFNCCKTAIPGMIEGGGGCIINIGSIVTLNVPPVNLTGYVIAKSALKALTRSLAVEFGPRGIRVNMVSPGMTETDLIAHWSERLRKVQAMQTPLRRLSQPNDVAQTVLFLCSDKAKFITGVDIPVCGGILM